MWLLAGDARWRRLTIRGDSTDPDRLSARDKNLAGSVATRTSRLAAPSTISAMTTLKLTPTESVTVRAPCRTRSRSRPCTARAVIRRPAHLHPSQAEHFEVLEGSVTTRVDGKERSCRPATRSTSPAARCTRCGTRAPCPRGCCGARAPAGRTLEWFGQLDALQREGRVLKNGMPSPLAMSVLLTEYRDVFRLGGPDPVLRAAFAMLAQIGRLRGYSTNRSGIRSASAPPNE